MSTVALQSPEDVINDSLTRIGYKLRVGSIFDGSEAAKIALDIYSQTRDNALRQFDWGFAERDVTLTLLKTAPVNGYGITPWTNAYPILPWIYEYGCPSDLIKVRSLRRTPVFIPSFDPSPVNFRMANDNAYNPAQKVILTNLPSAVLVYTAQVVDPTTWEPSFTESLCAALARRLAPSLSNLDVEKLEAQDEAISKQSAEMKIG